jgi:hypothetical protein
MEMPGVSELRLVVTTSEYEEALRFTATCWDCQSARHSPHPAAA